MRCGPDAAAPRRVGVDAVPLTREQDEAGLRPGPPPDCEFFDGFTADELRVLFRYFEQAAATKGAR